MFVCACTSVVCVHVISVVCACVHICLCVVYVCVHACMSMVCTEVCGVNTVYSLGLGGWVRRRILG